MNELDVTMDNVEDVLSALTLYMCEQVGCEQARRILEETKQVADTYELTSAPDIGVRN